MNQNNLNLPNGVRFQSLPKPSGNKFKFLVTEYYSYTDQYFSYPMFVPSDKVVFDEDNYLYVKDDAFNKLRNKPADEITVYPNFE